MIPPGQTPTTQLLDGIPPPKRKPSTSASGTLDPKKTRDDYLAKLKGENKQVWRAVVVLDKSLRRVNTYNDVLNHGGERLQGEGTAEEWNDWVKQQDWAALLSSLNQNLGGSFLKALCSSCLWTGRTL